jgi:hypothetical protein
MKIKQLNSENEFKNDFKFVPRLDVNSLPIENINANSNIDVTKESEILFKIKEVIKLWNGGILNRVEFDFMINSLLYPEMYDNEDTIILEGSTGGINHSETTCNYCSSETCKYGEECTLKAEINLDEEYWTKETFAQDFPDRAFTWDLDECEDDTGNKMCACKTCREYSLED